MARPERYVVALEYRGVPLDVDGYYSPSIPASGLNPEDSAEFEITTISVHGDLGVDLYSMLEGLWYLDSTMKNFISALDEVERLCIERIEQGEHL